MLFKLMDYLAAHKRERRSVKRPCTRRRSRPCLEGLEDRVLLNAGDLDPTFGTGGLVLTQGSAWGAMVSLALQPDGKILGGGQLGSLTSNSMGAVRYNTDGSLDTSFGVNGLASSGDSATERAMALQADGKTVVLGDDVSIGGVQFNLARFNSNGTLDTTFGTGGLVRAGVYGHAGGLAIQSDGKIVAVGAYAVYNGPPGLYTYYVTLVRFNADGSFDQSFGSGGQVSTQMASETVLDSVALQADGRIVVGGILGDPSVGNTDFVTLRYNTDGSRDYTWNGGLATTQFASYAGITALAIQPNGMVVAVGYVDLGGPSSAIALARYTTTGGTDIVVQTATAYGAFGHAVALQPDGKIIAAGSGSAYGSVFLVARYNYDGTLDSTFGSGAGYVTTQFSGGGADAVLLQTDGKIVAAGTGNYTEFGLARYLNDTPADFLVSGFPSSTTAGVAHSFTVTARNADGSRAGGYTGTVHFTSSDPQAALPADYTFTLADAGVHTFSATLKTAAAQSLTVTDSTLSSVTGMQSSISVNAAAASQLAISGFPSPATAGAAQNFTVTAQDAYGNPATTYRGTVKFTSSDTRASLPANYAFTSSDNGVHTFSATLKTAGTQSLTAIDRTTSGITGTQTGITVNAAAARRLSVAGFPSPTTAGAAHTFTVTAKDAYGNVATGYTGTVQFLSSDPRAVLPGNYTFVAGDAGVHSFSATLKTARTPWIGVRDTVTTSIAGSQNGITVNAAAAGHLWVAAPTTATAGTAFDITVTVLDPYGNTAPSYLGTVQFTSSDSQAGLPATYLFTATDAGQHTFTSAATLKTAGRQTITATDTVTTTVTGSASVNVTAAAAAILSVSAPARVTAGRAFTITLTALDLYGNRAGSYRGTVHFTSSDPQAVLAADYTFTAGDNGAHTLKNGATLKTVGTQSITARDTVTGTITGRANFTVPAAAPSTLFVSGFPSPIAPGTVQKEEDGPSAVAVLVLDSLWDLSGNSGSRGRRLRDALFGGRGYGAAEASF